MTHPQHQKAATEAKSGEALAVYQRDKLLLELERLTRMCSKDDPSAEYAEVHPDDVARAERLCKRIRSAIAKATGAHP